MTRRGEREESRGGGREGNRKAGWGERDREEAGERAVESWRGEGREGGTTSGLFHGIIFLPQNRH